MLNTKALALGIGTASAVLYLLCVLGTLLFPYQLLLFFNNFFHAVDLGAIYPAGKTLITPQNFVVGLVGIFVWSAFLGWLIAYFYNLFAKQKTA